MTKILVGLIAFAFVVAFTLLSSVAVWYAWGYVHQLFPFLPIEWHELSFWQVFCLMFIIRTFVQMFKEEKPKPSK